MYQVSAIGPSPLISVITPVFNGIRFIEACIHSVAKEACKLDLEHIVIDGRSTDGTAEILSDLACHYAHLRFLSENDLGQSDAMNKGIGLSRGPILGVLNVDDYYEQDALARASSYLLGLPEPSMVIGNCRMWDENSRLLGTNRPSRLTLDDLLRPGNEHLLPINPTQYLYHSSVHQAIGLFPVDEHYVMDLDFFLKAVAAINIQYYPELWGNFRLIPGCKTKQDIDSGSAEARLQRLLQRHRAQNGMCMTHGD
ncbi:glycosyltransferase family 2 protein [Cyanobium sp. CH-040]|uniref:glycosyltransferase family 2 protein n=1 Tax=Cyanobium sp. CH-040 TaxID=2823708 RepID=UPI0020CF407E|nr:glycosyltransferase family 2 protein [Cyanobium sp. CH-040]MCP9926745.1 glycosyltransferase [Cyanobium sp. CH-040]